MEDNIQGSESESGNSKLVSSVEALFSPFFVICFYNIQRNYRAAVDCSRVNEDQIGFLKHLSIFQHRK